MNEDVCVDSLQGDRLKRKQRNQAARNPPPNYSKFLPIECIAPQSLLLLLLLICIKSSCQQSEASLQEDTTTATELPTGSHFVKQQSWPEPNSNLSEQQHRSSHEATADASSLKSFVVSTRRGQFRGLELVNNRRSKLERQVVGFFGIRYASAPVKRLRFMPPTAFSYFQGKNIVHDATNFGPICIQRFPIELNFKASSGGQRRAASATLASTLNESASINADDFKKIKDNKSTKNSNYESQFDEDWRAQLKLLARLLPRKLYSEWTPKLWLLSRKRIQSEDCLNLNIYAPESALLAAQTSSNDSNIANQAPVLVVLHGESFDFGAGSVLDGRKFAAQHNSLVVTFNFRLNIFGFPPKTNSALRANFGFLDQIAALHWIRDNIAAFGGSPSNVTILGAKKGAAFVNLLMSSPLAKDLFQRAVMEDGSALSPLIVASQSQASANHLRLLARLCDCPVPQQFTTATTTATTTTNLGAQQRHYDATRANVLMFECLRQKPADWIAQRMPLQLLHVNQTTGSLNFSPAAIAATYNNAALFDNQQQQKQTVVDMSQVSRFVESVAQQQLDQLEIDHGAKLSDAFSSIYAQQPLRPLFGPTIDETIISSQESSAFIPVISSKGPSTTNINEAYPSTATTMFGDDLAASLLSRSAPFAARHLLIGVSRPTFVDTTRLRSFLLKTKNLTATQTQHSNFLIHADHPLADKFSIDVERQGLSVEQSLELINSFVASFFRFHSQEISNSIVNNYLSASSPLSSTLSASTKATLPITTRQHYNDKKNEQVQGHDNEIDQETLVTHEQLSMLSSLVDAFQDSLNTIPVLKTALIHANSQLLKLSDVFVKQQFAKLSARHRLNNYSSKYQSESDEQQLVSETLLGESFVSFALALYASQSSFNNLSDIKSTFVYQLDENLLKLDLLDAIRYTLQRVASDGKSSEWLEESLNEILAKAKTTQSSRRLSFECPFLMQIQSLGETEDIDDNDREDEDTIDKWMCAKLSGKLAQFVHGSLLIDSKLQQPENETEVVQQLNNCIDSISSTLYKGDATRDYQDRQDYHHSVNLAEDSTSKRKSAQCNRQLRAAALEFVVAKQQQQQLENRWPLFDVFRQKLAATVATSDGFSVSSFLEASYSSLPSRLTFWFNFVPALNCSKTQPLTPNGLLKSLSSPNSTLLGLNLQFNCHTNAPKNSHDLLELLGESMRQQLMGKLNDIELQRKMQLISSQHHKHHQSTTATRSASFSLNDTTNIFGSEQLHQPQSEDNKLSPLLSTNNTSDISLTIREPSETTGDGGNPINSHKFAINNSLVLWALIGGLALVCSLSWFVVRIEKKRRKQQQQQESSDTTSKCADSSQSNENDDLMDGFGQVRDLRLKELETTNAPVTSGQCKTKDLSANNTDQQSALVYGSFNIHPSSAIVEQQQQFYPSKICSSHSLLAFGNPSHQEQHPATDFDWQPRAAGSLARHRTTSTSRIANGVGDLGYVESSATRRTAPASVLKKRVKIREDCDNDAIQQNLTTSASSTNNLALNFCPIHSTNSTLTDSTSDNNLPTAIYCGANDDHDDDDGQGQHHEFVQNLDTNYLMLHHSGGNGSTIIHPNGCQTLRLAQFPADVVASQLTAHNLQLAFNDSEFIEQAISNSNDDEDGAKQQLELCARHNHHSINNDNTQNKSCLIRQQRQLIKQQRQQYLPQHHPRFE